MPPPTPHSQPRCHSSPWKCPYSPRHRSLTSTACAQLQRGFTDADRGDSCNNVPLAQVKEERPRWYNSRHYPSPCSTHRESSLPLHTEINIDGNNRCFHRIDGHQCDPSTRMRTVTRGSTSLIFAPENEMDFTLNTVKHHDSSCYHIEFVRNPMHH